MSGQLVGCGNGRRGCMRARNGPSATRTQGYRAGHAGTLRLGAMGAHLVAMKQIAAALVEAGHLSLERAARLVGPDGSLADAVDELMRLGFPIVLSPDGLSWCPGRESMSSTRIEALLREAGHECPVECLALTDSTNARLLARAIADERGPCALLAECQSAGRGRRQRVWQARFGESILFSLLLDTGRDASELPGLAIATGAALANALADMGVEGIALKWPNDVLLCSAKLAGILVEAPGRASSPGVAVVGVGINWRLSDQARAGIDQPVSDLAVSLPLRGLEGRTEIAGRLIASLLTMGRRFRLEGLEPFLRDYARFDLLSGRPVAIRTEAGEKTGIVRGLAADGALRVVHGDIEHRYRSGDISVRTR